MIRSEPIVPNEINLFDQINGLAFRINLAVHNLLIHEVGGPHVATPRRPESR